jgi:hypothetical protein
VPFRFASFLVNYGSRWLDPAEDDRHRDWTRAAVRAAAGFGLAGTSTSSPNANARRRTPTRLNAVKRSYDPDDPPERSEAQLRPRRPLRRLRFSSVLGKREARAQGGCPWVSSMHAGQSVIRGATRRYAVLAAFEHGVRWAIAVSRGQPLTRMSQLNWSWCGTARAEESRLAAAPPSATAVCRPGARPFAHACVITVGGR